jgi:hypothetical protein
MAGGPTGWGQRLQQWAAERCFAGRYGSRVSGIWRGGDAERDSRTSRRRCVGDGEKNEETDCQRLLSGESQASSGHWLFRL